MYLWMCVRVSSCICILFVICGLLRANNAVYGLNSLSCKHSQRWNIRWNAWMANAKKFRRLEKPYRLHVVFVGIAIAGVLIRFAFFCRGWGGERSTTCRLCSLALSLSSFATPMRIHSRIHSKKGNSHRKRIAQKLISKGVFIAFFHTEDFSNTIRVLVFIFLTVQCWTKCFLSTYIHYCAHTHTRTPRSDINVYKYIFIERTFSIAVSRVDFLCVWTILHSHFIPKFSRYIAE